MNPETLFMWFNNGVIPAWLLLVFAPRWRFTQSIVHAFWIPVILGLGYLLAIVNGAGEGAEGAGFSSLPGVMLLFASPWGALAGWIHYLAFDLFVGAWEVRDAQRRNIPHLWVCFCLVFTLMMGPVGLLLYAGLRLLWSTGFSMEENGPLQTP
ncbi:MAG: ABA4-like family protein [Myxococcota bacterium]|nr:ABA4-like family protein [Myxococcota bacterium]